MDNTARKLNLSPELGGSYQAAFFKPVLDHDTRVAAYLIQPPYEGELKTARGLLHAFHDWGLSGVAADKKLLLNLHPALLLDPELSLLPSRNLVLVFPGQHLPDSEAVARLRQLKSRDIGVGLNMFQYQTAFDDILKLVDWLFMDFTKSSADSLMENIKLRSRKLKLVADNVSEWEQLEQAASLRFDYVAGTFMDESRMGETIGLSHSEEALIALFNCLHKEALPDEVELLADHVKTETSQLLRYMNAVGVADGIKLDSLTEALMMLGYIRVLRWVAVVLMGGKQADNASHTIYRAALMRGRLCELIAGKLFPNSDRDLFFIAGMFSMLPTALSQPKDYVLEKIALPPAIKSALTDNNGPYAPFMRLARAVSGGDALAVNRLSKLVRHSSVELFENSLQAYVWAMQVGGSA